MLEAVKRKLPTTFGLVNRRSQEYLLARCTEMALAPEDERIVSPDPTATPGYYRDRPCPAWFLFQEIKKVDLDGWNREFSGFGEPTGDDSLYWIEDDAKPGGEQSSEIPRYENGAPGEGILHISDLHFGADHGFTLDGSLERNSMRQLILTGVRDANVKVGVMIISGDITTGGDLTAMQSTGLEEIRGLAADLELPIDNVVVVPGNHDIKLIDADPGSYAHERGFRTFLTQLFESRRREPEGVFVFELPGGRTLNIAALNSVRLSNKETREYGYVGPRSKFVFDALSKLSAGRDSEDLARRGILNMVVLHHHLISGALTVDPPPTRPLSVTLDAGRIIAEAQDAAVHIAVHGHEHLPFVGSVARQEPLEQSGWDGYRRPLTVIGGGSAGAKLDRLPMRMRDNTYGLYVPLDGGLEVNMYRFNQQVKPHRLLRTNFQFAES